MKPAMSFDSNLHKGLSDGDRLEYLGNHFSRVPLKIPCCLDAVQAGFPSPADDCMDKRLDLNGHLVAHPATFYCRVSGNSMEAAGIFDGDLPIADRSPEPGHRDIVVAFADGELTCKIIDAHERCLPAASDAYPPYPSAPISA